MVSFNITTGITFKLIVVSILLYFACQTMKQESPTARSVRVTTLQVVMQWKYKYKIVCIVNDNLKINSKIKVLARHSLYRNSHMTVSLKLKGLKVLDKPLLWRAIGAKNVKDQT